MALTDKLSAIGDAIRSKTGKSDLLTLDEMPVEIAAIETGGGIDAENLILTGDCTYRFANGGWDWVVNKYGDKISTQNITNANSMFYYANKLEQIPFDINLSDSGADITQIFMDCTKLKKIPKIIGKIKPNTNSSVSNLFYSCFNITEITDDDISGIDFSNYDNLPDSSTVACLAAGSFRACSSLRKIPMIFFEKGGKSAYASRSGFTNLFDCYALDELVNIPICNYLSIWTYDGFGSFAFSGFSHAKNITFAMPNGEPYVVKWKNQMIDLTQYVGYIQHYSAMTGSTELTLDTYVGNDTTYQQLKNNDDWWTQQVEYSRYNHDSAVNTINSLPDTSAYLATQTGGTNIIKFTGAAGSATDGGAISTLTAEEIAIATAKGWTVTLV